MYRTSLVCLWVAVVVVAAGIGCGASEESERESDADAAPDAGLNDASVDVAPLTVDEIDGWSCEQFEERAAREIRAMQTCTLNDRCEVASASTYSCSPESGWAVREGTRNVATALLSAARRCEVDPAALEVQSGVYDGVVESATASCAATSPGPSGSDNWDWPEGFDATGLPERVCVVEWEYNGSCMGNDAGGWRGDPDGF